MRSIVKDITKKTVAFLLIGVVAMLIINKSIYTHSHKMADGYTYTHAHPYDRTADNEPFKAHQHTNSQIIFFQSLEVLFVAAVLFFFFIRKITRNRYLLKQLSVSYISVSLLHRDRAPPLGIFSKR